MTPKFAVGDKVRHEESGLPTMTVKNIRAATEHVPAKITAIWKNESNGDESFTAPATDFTLIPSA
jgi:hypothetical protein